MKIIFGKGFCGKKRLFKKLLDKTLEITGNKVPKVTLGLKFVSGDEIQMLNTKHRGVERVTDVLSFPMLDIIEGHKLNEFESERDFNGTLYIGDIVVCKDKIKAQAVEFGNSYKRELCFLVVHGYLHLLGYDHMTADDEKRMMNLTENVLLNFGLEKRDV